MLLNKEYPGFENHSLLNVALTKKLPKNFNLLKTTYPPPHHQIDDIQKMIALIKNYPLAMLVSAKEGKPFVTHIPIIYHEGSGKLVAHIDRHNPQIATLTNDAEVTVVFKGPDAYISPSVYSTKQLPTWNYIMVHITGAITLIKDPEAAKETMIAMTKFLEGTDQKYVLSNDNPRMDAAVNYIQAFDITITNWEGKFKLSQDKNKKDQAAAKEALLNKENQDNTPFVSFMYMN
jgi:transcriptional regulator